VNLKVQEVFFVMSEREEKMEEVIWKLMREILCLLDIVKTFDEVFGLETTIENGDPGERYMYMFLDIEKNVGLLHRDDNDEDDDEED
jgi:hypothetical protein